MACLPPGASRGFIRLSPRAERWTVFAFFPLPPLEGPLKFRTKDPVVFYRSRWIGGWDITGFPLRVVTARRPLAISDWAARVLSRTLGDDCRSLS